jgi:hypothetical protein
MYTVALGKVIADVADRVAPHRPAVTHKRVTPRIVVDWITNLLRLGVPGLIYSHVSLFLLIMKLEVYDV